ncbi:TadE/TadG family type IV pilus assembly protein [Nocardioides marmoribigeumensis]|uniref:TadE-like domain-containing protein n=1 Tax=Nocardioides marmoribigeumensis TaxID=433649 RepID=A0ABU2BS39_9ACTN|nr:TadE/TadG family type IV pilus assembly protein [Nocardioides marmoribigeumensis]MDR7360538.1 hypothetical protein [Nocardioides marmoribigeumensis]
MAVEFALVVPLLLLIVFGIIQYGLYFFSMQGGSAAARDAARAASVGKMATCAEFVPWVKARVGSANFGDVIDVKREYPDGTGIGKLVKVTVSFDSLNLHFPLIPVPGDGEVSTVADTRVEFEPTTPEECS